MSTVVELEIEDHQLVNNIQDLSIQEQVIMGFLQNAFFLGVSFEFPKCVPKFHFIEYITCLQLYFLVYGFTEVQLIWVLAEFDIRDKFKSLGLWVFEP